MDSKEAKAILDAAVKATVTVIAGGTETLNVVIGSTVEEVNKEVDKIVVKALRDGSVVKFPDGRKVWDDVLEVVDTTKEGSQAYTWHKDGNRVLFRKVRFTKSPDGVVTKEDRGTCWRLFQ